MLRCLLALSFACFVQCAAAAALTLADQAFVAGLVPAGTPVPGLIIGDVSVVYGQGTNESYTLGTNGTNVTISFSGVFDSQGLGEYEYDLRFSVTPTGGAIITNIFIVSGTFSVVGASGVPFFSLIEIYDGGFQTGNKLNDFSDGWTSVTESGTYAPDSASVAILNYGSKIWVQGQFMTLDAPPDTISSSDIIFAVPKP